mmetsp:Transcript_219/g.289  ORF Transcript_219/g.289 Transcript_219/m.289 type:complete len:223 (-) Transcript_219:123-791(-)
MHGSWEYTRFPTNFYFIADLSGIILLHLTSFQAIDCWTIIDFVAKLRLLCLLCYVVVLRCHRNNLRGLQQSVCGGAFFDCSLVLWRRTYLIPLSGLLAPIRLYGQRRQGCDSTAIPMPVRAIVVADLNAITNLKSMLFIIASRSSLSHHRCRKQLLRDYGLVKLGRLLDTCFVYLWCYNDSGFLPILWSSTSAIIAFFAASFIYFTIRRASPTKGFISCTVS